MDGDGFDASEYDLVRPAVVGLLSGSPCSGRIRNFLPGDTELVVEIDGRELSDARRVPMHAVAYVAFRRGPDSPPCKSDGSAPLRVHIARGATFLVQPLTDPTAPLGFIAGPIDPESPFEEMYFFAHGVNALERDEAIGSMLLEAGALTQEDLNRGLDQQAKLRRKRIGEILLEQSSIDVEALGAALTIHQRTRVRLGEVLVDAGLATREDIEAALVEQRKQGGKRIGEVLVEMGVVTELVLAQTLARKFHLPFVDLDECLIDPRAMRVVPRTIIDKHAVLPIESDGQTITLALSDPLNTEPIDLIRFQRPEKIREVVAVPSQLRRYLGALLLEADAHEKAAAPVIEMESRFDGDLEPEDGVYGEGDESDGAIIQLANQIIAEAVEREASDVHIEPNGSRGAVHIRFRIDGQCIALPEVPAEHRNALVSRLKIMASLDISERRKPQDGKIRVRVGGRTIDLRVATLPTLGGEDVVLRVLSSSKPLPMNEMWLSERNRAELERVMSSPYGLVLCVGPTGSGKTTALHSLLARINNVDRKIWTAEDPVEITQAGLRQVQVQPKIGFGFAEALRAFLRADPDVVMVGEMRDKETADIALRASLTGHLVLSTLHTNSAPETVTRMIDIGLDPFSFGDALLGVLAQRLARRLCEGCRSLEPAPEADRQELGTALGALAESAPVGRLLWRARGCSACRGTGYKGRVALHEFLVVDDVVRAAIQARSNSEKIRELAMQGGMTTLLQDGAQKCLEGVTDLKQVLAVCLR
jgi:type II secretory ATPase GspE/PulE/Tfp pilus assembly ATPase PilB-like protein